MSHSCHASHSPVTALASSPCPIPHMSLTSSAIIALQLFAFVKQLFGAEDIIIFPILSFVVSNTSSSSSLSICPVSGFKWSVGNIATNHTYTSWYIIGSSDFACPPIGLMWPCVHSERSSQFFQQRFSLPGQVQNWILIPRCFVLLSER